MNALQQFPTPINAFISWCNVQGPQKAGLPVESFERLHVEASKTLAELAVTGQVLYALRDAWANTVAEGATSPPAAMLLFRMNEASAQVNALQGQAGSLQSILQPVLPIVTRRRGEISTRLTDTRNRLNQAKAEKQRLDARIAETKRKIAARQGDVNALRMQLAQDTFSTITNDIINLQYGLANEERLEGQLKICDDLSAALSALRTSLADSRNLMAAAGEPMTSAIRAETKVLGTSRRGVAAYYKREVGREMDELIATFA